MRILRQLRVGATGAVALVVAVLAVPLWLTPAAGQGATGGSIGKQDKSVSGSTDEDRPRSRSTERSKPKSERSSSGGDGSSYDGRYTINMVGGSGCSGQQGSTDFVISGGRVNSGTGFQMTVSGSGALRGSFNKEGLVGTLSGRMSGGSSGSGTINLPKAGCKLSFTLAKK